MEQHAKFRNIFLQTCNIIFVMVTLVFKHLKSNTVVIRNVCLQRVPSCSTMFLRTDKKPLCLCTMVTLKYNQRLTTVQVDKEEVQVVFGDFFHQLQNVFFPR